jgi:ribosomal protein S18 acetylase RimI-like enzyme
MLCDATGKVLAVGRLHGSGDHTAQIRYMAVDAGYQRQGLGSRILEQLEQAAAAAGYERIVLHARELAVPFYLSRGYRIIEPSHRLFGAIQHFLMSRELGVAAPHS